MGGETLPFCRPDACVIYNTEEISSFPMASIQASAWEVISLS